MAITSRPGRRTWAAGIVAALAVTGAIVAITAPPAGAAACPALPATLPAPASLPAISELPDPFTYYDGSRLTTSADWSCRRAQLAELAQTYEYGHLPPPPTSVTGTRNGTTLTVTVQANARTASFTATVRLPAGNGPFPAIILLNGLAASATNRGYAEVTINPNSIAADSTSKTGAFWTLYNGANVDTGVLMAWAWGVHRTLDAIKAAIPQIDSTKVGVSGYSRYGKAAVVAGAFDERIALTIPGSSGTAGMGNYRFFFTGGSNDETLNDILGAAYWFTPRFAQFRNQANRLPFDQNSVVALVAPRPLLATSGTEGSDIRTNPQGSGLTYRGAKMVYQYLGVPDRIGIAYRPGGHQVDLNDYNAIMDFADKNLMNKPISRTFDSVPYPAPTAAQIPWTIPTGGGPTTTSPTVAPTTGPTRPPTGGPTTSPTNNPTTPPATTPPPSTPTTGCGATMSLQTWTGGFVATVRVTAANSPVNSWNTTISLPSGANVTNTWNASAGAVSGLIRFSNVSYNGHLNPGQTTEFGFQGTGNPAGASVTNCGAS